MPYCVHCGVELNAAIFLCPLCQTPVIDPNQTPQPVAPGFFPHREEEIAPVSKRVLALLLSSMLASVAVCCAVLNLFLLPEIAWALFAVGAAAMLWVWFVLPLLLGHSPIWLRLTLDVCAVGLYVYLIALAVDGQFWFRRLALPILTVAAIIVLILSFLLRGGRRSMLSTLVLSLLSLGCFTLGVELSVNRFLHEAWQPAWSLVVLATCVGLCMPLIIVRRVPSLREEVRRRFHF